MTTGAFYARIGLLKGTSENRSASSAESDFSSGCAKIPQEYCCISREFCALWPKTSKLMRRLKISDLPLIEEHETGVPALRSRRAGGMRQKGIRAEGGATATTPAWAQGTILLRLSYPVRYGALSKGTNRFLPISTLRRRFLLARKKRRFFTFPVKTQLLLSKFRSGLSDLEQGAQRRQTPLQTQKRLIIIL